MSDSIETLTGRSDVLVTSVTGDHENIEVRALGVHQMKAMQAALVDGESALGSLYAGRSVDWFESLTPDSQEAVILKGRELNWDFFSRWVLREQERRQILTDPEAQKMFVAAIEKSARDVMQGVAQSLLTDGSPTSPSQPGDPSSNS